MAIAFSRMCLKNAWLSSMSCIGNNNVRFQTTISPPQCRSMSSRIAPQTWSWFTLPLITRCRRFMSTSSNWVNATNSEGETSLHAAVRLHHITPCYGRCKKLLHSGANPNIPDCAGKTPLDTAIENKNRSIVNLLREYGALTSAEIASGYAP
jgi:hypothetical protein